MSHLLQMLLHFIRKSIIIIFIVFIYIYNKHLYIPHVTRKYMYQENTRTVIYLQFTCLSCPCQPYYRRPLYNNHFISQDPGWNRLDCSGAFCSFFFSKASAIDNFRGQVPIPSGMGILHLQKFTLTYLYCFSW